MTRKEFEAYDIRTLSEKAQKVWAESDQGLYDYVKDCKTAEEISEILEGLADDGEPEKYYWFDTETGELICGERDEDGNKDRNTETVVVRDIYEGAGVDPHYDPDEVDELEIERKIDAYIEARLGFMPEYEYN